MLAEAAEPMSIAWLAGAVVGAMAVFKTIEVAGPRLWNGRNGRNRHPKPGAGDVCREHAERLVRQETNMEVVKAGVERIEDDVKCIDRKVSSLIERNK